MAAVVSILLVSGPALASRCTGTCGDGSTFDKTASSCDACRMMQCPRTCKLEGVETCLWCGRSTDIEDQITTAVITVRLGPNPNDPTAPTDTFSSNGRGRLIPFDSMELPDGRVQIPIEMIQLELHGVSPILGPVDTGLRSDVPTRGVIQDRFAGSQFPADSYFDIFAAFTVGSRHWRVMNPIHTHAAMEAGDPIAGDDSGPAPVVWNSEGPPVPIVDENGVLMAWVLQYQHVMIFDNGDAVTVDPPAGAPTWNVRIDENPAKADAAMTLDVAEPGQATVVVYDASGRKIRSLFDGSVNVGLYRVHWDRFGDDGRLAPSGVYFYRVAAKGFQKAIKFVLL